MCFFTPFAAPPQVVCERLGRAVSEEQIRVDMMQQRAVVSELFSSVCAEIRDEVSFSLQTFMYISHCGHFMVTLCVCEELLMMI